LAWVFAALAVATSALWIGSTSSVRPPEAPVDPVAVHLLATGRHSGLLLPCGDGRTVEYGYGEWGFYALDETAWWRAVFISLVPSQGTLGRRYVDDAELGTRGVYRGGTLATILVPRRAVVALVARLDAEFAAGGIPRYSALSDMSFVKHPHRFHLLHDCHDEVASWLRELGCSVGWAPIRDRLIVRR
jgi:hypothetical protein